VGLAERFRTQAAKQEGVSTEESNAFNNYLLSLGIASPVTKESTGALFHSELARQLCDFLVKPLQHVGGNMSLADVYCLFNRARGTGATSTGKGGREGGSRDQREVTLWSHMISLLPSLSH